MLRRIRSDITVNAADKVYKSVLPICWITATLYGLVVTNVMVKDLDDYKAVLQRLFTPPVMM